MKAIDVCVSVCQHKCVCAYSVYMMGWGPGEAVPSEGDP